MVSKTMFETHADDNALILPTGPVADSVNAGSVTITGPDGANTAESGDMVTVNFTEDTATDNYHVRIIGTDSQGTQVILNEGDVDHNFLGNSTDTYSYELGENAEGLIITADVEAINANNPDDFRPPVASTDSVSVDPVTVGTPTITGPDGGTSEQINVGDVITVTFSGNPPVDNGVYNAKILLDGAEIYGGNATYDPDTQTYTYTHTADQNVAGGTLTSEVIVYSQDYQSILAEPPHSTTDLTVSSIYDTPSTTLSTDDLAQTYTINLLTDVHTADSTSTVTIDPTTVGVTLAINGQSGIEVPTTDSHGNTLYTVSSDGHTITFTEAAFAYVTGEPGGSDQFPTGASASVTVTYTATDTSTNDTVTAHETVVVNGTTETGTTQETNEDATSVSGQIGVERALPAEGSDPVTAVTVPTAFVGTHIVDATDSTGAVVHDGNGDAIVAGTFDVAADGSYTFTVNDAGLQYLHTGDHVFATLDVPVTGGDPSDLVPVTVTIDGVDDAATSTGGFAVFTDDTHAITPAPAVSELATNTVGPIVSTIPTQPTGGFTADLTTGTSDADNTLSVDSSSVTFHLLDANGNAIAGPVYALDGTHAFLGADGKTLHVDTTYLDGLNVGQFDQLRVDYQVAGDTANGAPAEFSDFRVIVVDGTNNAPTLTGVATAEVSEAALSTTTFNLLANVTDVDNAHSSLSITGTPSVTITTSAAGATPTALPSADYSISSAGVLTLAPGAYTDALHYGDHDTITVSYTVSDNNATSPQTVADTYTITLDGSAEQVYGNGTFSGTAYGDVIHGSYGAPNTSEINPATAPAPSTVTSNDTITAGAGDDTVYAGDGSNTLFGNTGNDVIYGGSSSDTISGGAGDDQLHGGNGNDFLEGGAGNDTIDGGAGYNIVTYTQSGSGVNINLYDEVNGNPTNTSLDGVHGAGTDTLSNIQGAYGSAFGDHIQGNDAGTLAAPEILQGQGGDDTIFAGDGVNSIFGNTGNDIIHGGSNNDLLNGGAGNDTIYSSHGTDVLQGGAGIDTINYRGAETAVTVDLTLQGGTSGGALTAQNVYTDNHGNAVTETLSGFENIFGSNHSDTLTGDANANTINGWYGADTINGGGGNDTIFGDHGDDTLFGNAGDDTIHGGQGDDHINGGQGNDTLYGDSGVNTLTGGQGADTFVLYYGDGSTNTSIGNSDTIADFSHADGDKIDLSALAAATQHSITYSGATFSGAADSLIVIQDPNAGVGHYLIEVDINGDGTADFFTHVVGQTLAGGGFGPAPTQTDTASDFTGLTYTPASLDTLHIVAHHDNLLG